MIKPFSQTKAQKILAFCFLVSTLLYLQSCITTPSIAYFQSTDTTKFKILPKVKPTISRIQGNDILAITVGTLNQESNEILNFANVSSIKTTNFPGQTGNTGGQPLGYLVDTLGFVDVPFIGKTKLLGLTLDEAAITVKTELIKLLKDPSVNVRFLNHKFSILGEVARPATYSLLDDYTTLPEALGMAGDLTSYGNREKIMVIREENGIRAITRINLLSQEIFNSPYYYIRNGDMIYIEPLKSKSTFNDQKVQLTPLYLSVASTVLVTLSLLINLFK